MPNLARLFKFLDDHILEGLTLFLLAFIPLYPKLPLFDILPGYIVRVRIEDFLVAGTLFIWLIWLWRKKISFGPNPLAKPILIYLTIGILSMISAVFITQTVPLQPLHVGKMFLHFLRRVEYFSLFFVFYSTIKSFRQVKIYLAVFILTILGVTIYGFGQKYLYWPAFSTMNREFSKGWMLYLTEHARVLSTFGGHYDLAAFIMMALVMLWSLFFELKRIWLKLLVFVALAGAFWILILTASRTSFLAYIGGILVLAFLWMFKRGVGWGITRGLAVVFLSIIVMLSFGDLSDRFTRLLRLDERFGGIKELVLRPLGSLPKDKAVFLGDELSQVTSKSDQQPTTVKPGTGPLAPADVDTNVPVLIEENLPGGGKRYIARPRTYSETALRFDLSTGIRLDTLWPRAWSAFLKNPLLGTGYSTLTKAQVTDFTEAESTDNDYLRALGETGFLGFGSFGLILGTIVWVIMKNLGGIKDNLSFSLAVGLTAIVFGLLVNAVYIDVFEASKVAFSFWALTGILLGMIKVQKGKIEAEREPLRLRFSFKENLDRFLSLMKTDKPWLVLIIIVAFFLRTYKLDNPVADWHSWRQADTSAVTRNFIKEGRLNFLYPTYDDLSSVASGLPNPRGLRYVEFPLYNASTYIFKKIFPEGSLEEGGRVVSIIFSSLSLVFLFLLVRKYLGRRTAYLSAIFFAVLPYNIYFSRVILPEPMMVALSLGMIYFFDRWLAETKIKYYLLSVVLAAGAILVKPYAVFLFLPMAYLWFQKRDFSRRSFIILLVYLFISILPFVGWRLWISQFPEGIPAFTWLLNGDGIRFKGAFFWWIFSERLGKLILGVWGLPLFALGILWRPKGREGWFFYWWLLAVLAYLFVFATGNVRHDYYQILTIPIICIFLAKGVEFLLTEGRKISNFAIGYSLLAICSVFMLAFGWYQIRDDFNINHPEIVEAGKVVDSVAPRKALVIAPYDGDTAFLYQTNRAGWPLMEGSLEKMIKMGADYYVSVRDDELTRSLLTQIKAALAAKLPPAYKLIKQEPNFVVIQLVPDFELPKD